MLSGNDGKSLSGWPFRVGRSQTALPLVTQLDGQGALDFVSELYSLKENICLFILWTVHLRYEIQQTKSTQFCL